MLLKGDCDGRFTAGRETCEPECEAFLPTESAPLGVGDRRMVPFYVADEMGY